MPNHSVTPMLNVSKTLAAAAATAKVKSSLPRVPNSARAKNPVLKFREASLATTCLFTVASIDAPALFSSTSASWRWFSGVFEHNAIKPCIPGRKSLSKSPDHDKRR